MLAAQLALHDYPTRRRLATKLGQGGHRLFCLAPRVRTRVLLPESCLTLDEHAYAEGIPARDLPPAVYPTALPRDEENAGRSQLERCMDGERSYPYEEGPGNTPGPFGVVVMTCGR